MLKREQVVVICLVVVVVLTICGVSLWLSRRDNRLTALEPTSTPTTASLTATQPTVDPMEILEAFGTQTAVAMQNSTDESPFDDEGGVQGELAMFATQTAIVLNHTPVATQTFLRLLPNQKYWSPPVDKSFFPYFIYDTSEWALTDLRTLASLRVSDCTLRVAGGRALGPGWSTESSFLQADEYTFTTILAKYETVPEFITYSLIENSVVFEITSPSAFEQCRQDGEIVLKSMLIP